MDRPPAIQPHTNLIVSPAVDTGKPIPYQDLRNRTVVITGGASGIGASIAASVAHHGGNVIIGDLNASAGEQLVAVLRQSTKHDGHHFLRLDVTSWESQADFFKQAASLSPQGGIDSVIANAGIAGNQEAAFEHPPDYSKIDHPPKPVHQILDINVLGVLYTTELALSYLSRNPKSTRCSSPADSNPRDRHLLLVSSIAGIAALPTQSLYCASKHYVVGLFRALRMTAPINSGVRVNMINPYFTNTPILGPVGPFLFAGASMATLEDVTNAAVRLIADKDIVGRALIITSRGTEDQIKKAGLNYIENDQHGNSVRDVFGHDWEQTDIFTRKMIALTNVVNAGKAWGDFIFDLLRQVIALFLKITGY